MFVCKQSVYKSKNTVLALAGQPIWACRDPYDISTALSQCSAHSLSLMPVLLGTPKTRPQPHPADVVQTWSREDRDVPTECPGHCMAHQKLSPTNSSSSLVLLFPSKALLCAGLCTHTLCAAQSTHITSHWHIFLINHQTSSRSLRFYVQYLSRERAVTPSSPLGGTMLGSSCWN